MGSGLHRLDATKVTINTKNRSRRKELESIDSSIISFAGGLSPGKGTIMRLTSKFNEPTI